MDRGSYRIFNFTMAGVLGLMFGYAGFFAYSGNGVQCVYKAATGVECAACGTTRAFHSFLTGQFTKGIALNGYALPLFVFFGLQFLGRLSLALLSASGRGLPARIQLWDGIISGLLFAVCFYPLISAQL